MSKPQVRVFNPLGQNGYTSLKRARQDVLRGRAHWREENALIEYVPADLSTNCREARIVAASPIWPAALRAEQIEGPAVEVSDSQMAQTFLAYPQRSLESCRPAYPALSRPGAGFGASN